MTVSLFLLASLGARRFLLPAMRVLSVSWPCCVKGKRERVAPRLYVHDRNRKLLEIGISVIIMQHPELKSTSETFLRLLTKKTFINGNKRVVTRSLTDV